MVLVSKPWGNFQLCIDYRRLNSITKLDVYPRISQLPRIDNLLQSNGDLTYISMMDLKAGYYQIKVAAEDQDKTSFITPFRIYRFQRLPFDLRNAPSTFSNIS